MSVSIDDLQQAVGSLFPNPESLTNEALRRAYINRQYYVTYHRLLNIIQENFTQYDMSNEGTFGNTGSHKRVYYVFDDIFDKTKSKNAQRLSLKFTSFLSMRHKADYHLDININQFEFSQALKFAKDIPELADKIVQEQKS